MILKLTKRERHLIRWYLYLRSDELMQEAIDNVKSAIKAKEAIVNGEGSIDDAFNLEDSLSAFTELAAWAKLLKQEASYMSGRWWEPKEIPDLE